MLQQISALLGAQMRPNSRYFDIRTALRNFENTAANPAKTVNRYLYLHHAHSLIKPSLLIF